MAQDFEQRSILSSAAFWVAQDFGWRSAFSAAMKVSDERGL